MSIFGSLNASVSGLQAQSDALGVISDNISNSNTVGFKERKATFESLVVNSGSTAGFSPGGVLADSLDQVREQGQLRSTNSNTDLAVQGSGFFGVKSETGLAQEGDTQLQFTRNGQFRVNDNGQLTNTAGQVLQGWRISPDGTLPADQQNPDSLSSVDVRDLQGEARETSSVTASAVVPADTDPAQAVRTNFGNGNPGDPLDAQFADNNVPGGSNNLNISDGSSTIDLALNTGSTSLENIENAINNPGSNPGGISTATTTGSPSDFSADIQNGRLIIESDGGKVDVASTSTGSTADLTQAIGLEDTDNNNVRAPQEQFTTQIFDAQGNAHNINIELAKKDAANTWQARINAPRRSDDPQAAPTGLFEDNASPPNTSSVAVGEISFNDDGSLNELRNFNEAGVSTSGGGNLQLNINFNKGGNATNTGEQEIDVDLGTPKDGGPNNDAKGRDGLQQADQSFTVNNIQQDGARFGNFTGVNVDDEGIVTANFDNGEQQDIFKIPVATFNSPNDLNRESGNIFQETRESGEPILNEAGIGGAGEIQPSALERSTVDLSNEFSDMIETQRVYTANTRVLSTSDEMLQTLNSAVR
mgnify:CR=1 FL=1